MKKLLFAFGIAALTLTATSCGGAGNTPSTLGDSVSVYMGKAQGAQFAQRLTSMPAEDLANFKKDAFLRGMRQAIMADTNDIGYLYGMSFGLQMTNQLMMMERNGVELNRDELYRSFANAFTADSISPEQMEADNTSFQIIMNKVQNMIMEKQNAARAAEREAIQREAKANEAAGAQYIAEQKQADPEIKTTESGLSYKVIKQGTGAKPTKESKVKVKYTGRLVDGTQFDSSNGNAVEFPVNGVISGFAEGLLMMNPGSQYVLYIPADIAYGNNSQATIPAGSTLVFDVEMVEVN